MLSAMFRRDYESLTAQGYALTPEDVVRLNALALRVRLSSAAPCSVHLPRLVFMPRDSRWRPQIVLREPTMAHELWIEQAAKWIGCDDDRNFLWLHAYALSRPAKKLPDAFKPARLVRKVYRFAAKRLCGFTREQLSAAVEYCLFGADWTAGEVGGKKRGKDKSKGGVPPTSTDAPSPTLGLLVDARALRLPVTTDDAAHMTMPELETAVRLALISAGETDVANTRDAAIGEYVRAREEIRERLSTTSKGEAGSGCRQRRPSSESSR